MLQVKLHICINNKWNYYYMIAVGRSHMRGKTLIQNATVLRKYPLVKKTLEDSLEEKSGMETLMAV